MGDDDDDSAMKFEKRHGPPDMSMSNEEPTMKQARLSLMKMLPPIMRSLKRAVGRTGDIKMAHHVQNKATKHHNVTRPRKTRPGDINRKKRTPRKIPDQPEYLAEEDV